MSEAVLHINSPDEAEAVFYEAFIRGDSEVMAALWAKGEVICIHPGSGIILGYEAVIRSWNHILENTQGSEIRYSLVSKTANDNMSVHIVSEEILQDDAIAAIVIATNVYQKFVEGWLMTEHHGSVMQQLRRGETLQ